MFTPLIATTIRVDCLHRPCLELWEAFLQGVRDERTLRHLFGHSLTHFLKHWQRSVEDPGRVLVKMIRDK
jgi:hypothetical protein